jgi:hypothetical protein
MMEDGSDRRAQVEDELGPIRDALSADGYRLEVTGAGELLSLRVVALEDACEECLVPPPVMAQMVSATLSGAYGKDDIAIEYPGSAR